MQHLI